MTDAERISFLERSVSVLLKVAIARTPTGISADDPLTERIVEERNALTAMLAELRHNQSERGDISR